MGTCMVGWGVSVSMGMVYACVSGVSIYGHVYGCVWGLSVSIFL